MHIDLENGGPEQLHADVAIIGAGAAGISMARRLLAGGLSVLLLESGGLDYEKSSADLNAGEIAGLDYYPLDHARLRLFGGTTAIWGGRCAFLDPIDLQPRPWVPHSGWPISYEELRQYYDEAGELFGLPAAMPDGRRVQAAGIPLPRFSEEELRTPLWIFDGQFDRFRFDRCQDIFQHPRCTVLTHATVREIVAEPSGLAIERLDVANPGGRQLQVFASNYVLAAGGIENPRLLLASRSVMKNGLGNDQDLVARFFMEHPHARGGRVADGQAWSLLAAFAKRRLGRCTIAPLIVAAPALQQREGLLNTSLTIAPRRPIDGKEAWAMRAYLHAKHRWAPDRFGRTLWKSTKQAVGWLQRRSDPLRPWALNRLGRLDLALVVRAEQSPNPDSRVLLSRECDAMGVPRAVLDWRTSALDVESVAGLVGAFGREAARLGLGRVEPAEWLSHPDRNWVTDPLISAHPIGGYHHMGTTRMASDPRKGVTDGQGRVHGIDNLYVAGSSLFPTSGWANPTVTIVALALRTGDVLIRKKANELRSSGLEARPPEMAAAVSRESVSPAGGYRPPRPS